ncbi:MAG: hypothetical protein QUS33_05975 [Dehalococcoidia bacterium]|nr:hypothetical protein [Dehalococcoidia bacterium]
MREKEEVHVRLKNKTGSGASEKPGLGERLRGWVREKLSTPEKKPPSPKERLKSLRMRERMTRRREKELRVAEKELRVAEKLERLRRREERLGSAGTRRIESYTEPPPGLGGPFGDALLGGSFDTGPFGASLLEGPFSQAFAPATRMRAVRKKRERGDSGGVHIHIHK